MSAISARFKHGHLCEVSQSCKKRQKLGLSPTSSVCSLDTLDKVQNGNPDIFLFSLHNQEHSMRHVYLNSALEILISMYKTRRAESVESEIFAGDPHSVVRQDVGQAHAWK